MVRSEWRIRIIRRTYYLQFTQRRHESASFVDILLVGPPAGVTAGVYAHLYVRTVFYVLFELIVDKLIRRRRLSVSSASSDETIHRSDAPPLENLQFR